MKNVLSLIIFFMFLSFGIAQNADRITINGKVIVDANDVEGLTISNTTSKRIAVTDLNGEFSLLVALSDKLEISALQFETVYMVVTKEIIASKQLTVFLNERLTTLDEVVILPFSLTGDLALDLNNIRIHNPKFENFYFREIDIEDNPEADIYYQKVENTILNKDRFYNGVDFVRITNWLIKPKFATKNNADNNTDMVGSNYDALRETYTKDFISSSFNIPEDEVEEFIAFAEANNTDVTLYDNGKDIELIEYLVNQSKLFLNNETNKN